MARSLYAALPQHLQNAGAKATKTIMGGGAVLLVGPPGGGKTQLARAFATARGSFGGATSTAIRGIHRMAGLEWDGETPPFRAPHHTTSLQGMVGVGGSFRPGELSLAHGGILFLDEVEEFAPAVLRAVARAHEQGLVEYGGRAPQHLVSLPADFALVATANSEDAPAERALKLLNFYQILEVPAMPRGAR